jgi:hypothetical protein
MREREPANLTFSSSPALACRHERLMRGITFWLKVKTANTLNSSLNSTCPITNQSNFVGRGPLAGPTAVVDWARVRAQAVPAAVLARAQARGPAQAGPAALAPARAWVVLAVAQARAVSAGWVRAQAPGPAQVVPAAALAPAQVQARAVPAGWVRAQALGPAQVVPAAALAPARARVVLAVALARARVQARAVLVMAQPHRSPTADRHSNCRRHQYPGQDPSPCGKRQVTMYKREHKHPRPHSCPASACGLGNASGWWFRVDHSYSWRPALIRRPAEPSAPPSA